jgi:sugar O-acyltransferase (sialic acid O-acetyltransferase NeuD family)
MKTGYIVGAGAQGRVVAEVWNAQHPAAEFFFLDDDPALQGRTVLGIPVIGSVQALETLDLTGAEMVLGIGHNPKRLALAERWEPRLTCWGTVIHPSATIMPSARIAAGAVVFAQAVVNTGARVGRHVVVNTGAIVEHDCVLEDGAYVAPGVCMGGRVMIGRGAFVSTGATLAPRVRIGAGAVVGAGALVIADVPAEVLVYGVPARIIRPLENGFDYGRLL